MIGVQIVHAKDIVVWCVAFHKMKYQVLQTERVRSFIFIFLQFTLTVNIFITYNFEVNTGCQISLVLLFTL